VWGREEGLRKMAKKKKPKIPPRTLFGDLNEKIDLLRKREAKKRKANLKDMDHLSPIVRLCLRNNWNLGQLGKPGSEESRVLRVLEAWQVNMQKFFHRAYRLRREYFNRESKFWDRFLKIAIAISVAKTSAKFYLSILFEFCKRVHGKPPFLTFCYSEKALRMVCKSRHLQHRPEGLHVVRDATRAAKRKHWEDYKAASRFYKGNRDEFDNLEEAIEYLYKLGRVSQSFFQLYFPKGGK
jgi:hypothetical protein